MEGNKEIETALAISMLFVAITSIFSLLAKVISCIVTGASPIKSIELFLFRNTLWIIVVIVVLIILRLYFNKIHQQDLNDVIKDPAVRLIVGILVIIDGLINLSNLLPDYINSIMSSTRSAHLMGGIAESIIKRIVIGDVASILIILCQIIFGVYFMRPYLRRR